MPRSYNIASRNGTSSVNGHGGDKNGAVIPTGKLEKPEPEVINGDVVEGVKVKDDKSEKKAMVGCFELFKYCRRLDKVLMVVGTIAAIIHGVAMPINVLLFGQVINAFADEDVLTTLFKQSGLANENITIDQMRENTTIKEYALAKMNVSWEYLEDALENSADTDMLERIYGLVYLFAVGGFCIIVLAYIHSVCWTYIAKRQTKIIRDKFFQSILRQDMAWFDTHRTAELNTRLSDDLDKLQDGIGDKMGTFINLVSTAVVGAIVAFVKSWQLTLVLMASFVVLTICITIISRVIPYLARREMKSYAAAGAVAEEVLSSIRTVVAFGGEDKECTRYNNNLQEARRWAERKSILVGLSMGVTWFIIYSMYAVAFFYGATLVRENEAFNVGDIMTVFLSIMIGAFSMGNAMPNLEYTNGARAAAYTIFNIIDRVPEINSLSEEGERPASMDGNISLTDVHFTYPSRPDVPVLQGLSLEVGVGQTAALVGASGCGKSTVVQLLQRFYDPTAGTVSIDGRDVSKLQIGWLRRHVGVVSQEPVLFAASIADNIRYGKTGVTDQEIRQACVMANARDFIEELPNTYETVVGERGSQLSGGQKQRIAIARALVRQPTILLLDEATSALDNESEHVVQEALDKASQGRTTIVVAHRLSTIKNADVIFGIKDGRVVERGSHEELLQQGGVYCDLVTRQMTSVEDVDLSTSSSEEEDGVEEDVIIAPIVHNQRLPSISSDQNGFSESEKETKPVDTVEKKKKKGLRRRKRGKKDAKDDDIPPPKMKDLLKLNAPEWPYILMGCVGALIGGAVHPCYSILISEVVNVFTEPDKDYQDRQIRLYCGLFVVTGGVAMITQFFQFFMFGKSGEALTERVRKVTFRAMLRQDMTYFDDPDNNTGALTARLATEASQVQGATGARVGMLVNMIGTLVVGLGVSLVFGWRLTLVILVFVPLMAIAGIMQMRVVMQQKSGAKSDYEEAGKISTEAIANIRTVASLSKEGDFHARYMAQLEPRYRSDLKRAHLFSLVFGVSSSVIMFAFGACMAYGAYLVSVGLMEFHMVLRVASIMIIGASHLGRSMSMYPDFGKAKAAAAKMWALVNRAPVIDSQSEAGVRPSTTRGEIEFSDVKFHYPSRPEATVLNHVSVRVKPGTSLALVGTSGCGKSTSVQLVQRLYDVNKGSVSVDGVDVRDLQVGWLRRQVGVVAQEPVLFDTSVRANIAYGDNSRDVSMEEVIAAARDANIHDFINSLPMGYETNVGVKGAQLSGGQKQRVAIARALVRQPTILLLDEATSALDTESEKVVQEALERAQAGRTSIVIAHRLSTIQNADSIAVVDRGHIVEQGTHSELMALEGRYYNLQQKSQKQK